MFASLCILGRQPTLGLAELESLYGADKLSPIGTNAVLVDVDPCLLAFDRLGGSIKFCKTLTELDTTNWAEIEKYLIKVSPSHSTRMPEGKMRLGLSLQGFNIPLKQIEATGLKLKSAIRQTGRNVRLIPNKDTELSSAQVIHNQLTGPTGWEIVFIKNGNKTLLVQTIKVQDITAYSNRDQNRPKRDAKVGMLPPKLAQIIVNLAVGELPEEAIQSVCEVPPDQPIPKSHFANKTVLDPFCGTGVILQEASLMGYGVYGTDIDQKMVDYSQVNLDWLKADKNRLNLETGDATGHKWLGYFDFVASETYLGRPFTSPPTEEVLSQTIHEVNTITKKFLQNLSGQTEPGFRLCIAIPAWHVADQVKHLPVIDQLTDIGYNPVKFVHAGDRLIYRREGQIVGRELITLIRK